MKSLLILILLASCGRDECSNYSSTNINPPYDTNFTQTTASGVRVDSSGQYVNLDTLDYVVTTVETCLSERFPNGLSSALAKKAGCYSPWQGSIRPLDRDCVGIKIPEHWRISCDSKQQLLDRNAPQEGCIAKGLNRDFNECPCSWRAGIQEDSTIVVTPDLYMLPDPLVRWMTGCLNVWIEEISPCVRPLTVPLTGDINDIHS